MTTSVQLFGGALGALAFGVSGAESTVALLLGLYSPVFREEHLFRGVSRRNSNAW